jgi:signal transduction histidine kinase
MLERALRDSLEEVPKSHLGAVMEANRSMDGFLRRLADYCRAGSSANGDTKVNAEFLIGNAILAAGISKAEPAPQIVTAPELSGVSIPSRVQRVFTELLENAVKFRSAATPAIEIQLDRLDSVLVFHVKDNGMGFEQESAIIIFEPLERLHGVGVYPGFGFGLAICRRIIGSLGGKIWAESVPGSGSTFSMSIPVH